MDELIAVVARALEQGSTIEEIHKAIIEQGWTEDAAFLGIQAGTNLHEANLKQIAELAAKPPPFGRKP